MLPYNILKVSAIGLLTAISSVTPTYANQEGETPNQEEATTEPQGAASYHTEANQQEAEAYRQRESFRRLLQSNDTREQNRWSVGPPTSARNPSTGAKPPSIGVPYNNSGEYILEGLDAEIPEGAKLPNIIYPYLPAGTFIENLGAGDIANTPNIGAVEKIILYLVRSFSRESSSTMAGSTLWNMAISFAIFGLTLSGILTFQAVSQGKKGPGEAIMSILMKLVIIVLMLTAIVPNLPPMLIGLTNYVTKGVSDWFGYANATSNGNMTQRDSKRTLWNLYQSKLNASHAAANIVWLKYLKAADSVSKNDPHLRKVMQTFVESMKADPDVKEALAWETGTGAFTGKSKWMQETWPTMDRMIADRMATQDINKQMTIFAQTSFANLLNSQAKHLEKAFKEHDATNRPGSEALIATIRSAPQGVDISGFTAPSRVLQTYAYLAFVYMSISIWGMGFASLAWVIIYAMPEEWQLSGILVSGFKGGLAVVLAGMLVAVYLSAGLVFTETTETALTKNMGEKSLSLTEKAIELFSSINPVESAKSLFKFATGPGDFIANLASQFSGNLLEHFILGVLILSAPAQAALMVKGANGIGEHGSKALTAGGAGAQGGPASFLGVQHQSGGINSAGLTTSDSGTLSRRQLIGGSSRK